MLGNICENPCVMKNVQEIYFRALIPFYKTEVFTSHGRAGKEKTVPLVLSRGPRPSSYTDLPRGE